MSYEGHKFSVNKSTFTMNRHDLERTFIKLIDALTQLALF